MRVYPENIDMSILRTVRVRSEQWTEYWTSAEDGWWLCISEENATKRVTVRQYQAHEVPEEVHDVYV